MEGSKSSKISTSTWFANTCFINEWFVTNRMCGVRKREVKDKLQFQAWETRWVTRKVFAWMVNAFLLSSLYAWEQWLLLVDLSWVYSKPSGNKSISSFFILIHFSALKTVLIPQNRIHYLHGIVNNSCFNWVPIGILWLCATETDFDEHKPKRTVVCYWEFSGMT